MQNFGSVLGYGFQWRAVKCDFDFRWQRCHLGTVVSDHAFQHSCLDKCASTSLSFTRELHGILSKRLCPLLDKLHVLVQLVQLPVSYSELVFLVCQFLINGSQLVLQFFQLLRQDGTISFLVGNLHLQLVNLQHLLMFLFFQMFHHRRETFHTTFCQCYFHPKIAYSLVKVVQFLFL